MINANLKQSNAYSKIKGIDFNNHDNSVFVFPFKFYGGFLNVSEKGQNNNVNDKPWNHNFFQKVFTGREVINVKWEDSTRLKKPLGKNYYDYDFRVGKYHLGTPISNNQATTISANNVQTDFSNFVTDQNITLKFNAKYLGKLSDSKEEFDSIFRTWNLTDEDFFKIYLIPELGGNKWFYISNCEYFSNNIDGEVESVEVTFSTLSDKIQSSGLAVEQYVQIGGPGEPYAYPRIEAIDLNGYTMRVVRLDEEKKNLNGSKYCQIEFQGNPGIVSCYFMGRPANGRVEASRHVFFKDFYTPQYNQINKTSTPSETFVWIPNCAPVNSWSSEAMSALKNSYQPTEGLRNISFIRTDQDRTTILKSNPDNLRTGMKYAFKDRNWGPTQKMELTPEQKTYVTANYTYSEDLEIKDTDYVASILAKNAFIYSGMWVLPLSYESNRPYYVKDIPIIGGFLNMLKLGDFAITADNQYIKNTNLNMFMDYQRYQQSQYLGITPSGTQLDWNNYIPANFFAGDTSAPQLFNVASTNVSLFGDFTSKIDINNKEYDTSYLGQSLDENFQPINQDGSSLKYNSDTILLRDNENKIIDRVIIQALFSGRVKITFFDENKNQIWTTTIVTNSEWTGSILDYSAIYETTAWPVELCDQSDSFTWPQGFYNDDNTTLLWKDQGQDIFGAYASNFNNFGLNQGPNHAYLSNYFYSKNGIMNNEWYSYVANNTGVIGGSLYRKKEVVNQNTINYYVDKDYIIKQRYINQGANNSTANFSWKDLPTITNKEKNYFIKQNVFKVDYKFYIDPKNINPQTFITRLKKYGIIFDMNDCFFVRKAQGTWTNLAGAWTSTWNTQPSRLADTIPTGRIVLTKENHLHVFNAYNQDYNPSYLGENDYTYIQQQATNYLDINTWHKAFKGYSVNYDWFGVPSQSIDFGETIGANLFQLDKPNQLAFKWIDKYEWQFSGPKNNYLWNANFSTIKYNIEDTPTSLGKVVVNVTIEYHNDFLFNIPTTIEIAKNVYKIDITEETGATWLDTFKTILGNGATCNRKMTNSAITSSHEYTAQISIKRLLVDKSIFNV